MIVAPIVKRVGSAPTLLALVALGGCASLGGNIAGSFSCPAPDDICAPASSIDDHALALISGDEGDRFIAPLPRASAPKAFAVSDHIRALQAPSTASAVAKGAPRTSEKVLRIVLQPYVDDHGRWHEASAVHAVVQQGEWEEQARLEATPLGSVGLAPAPTNGDTVDAALAHNEGTGISMGPPDATIVDAARARAGNPLADIKADVDRRLKAERVREPGATDGRIGAGSKPDASNLTKPTPPAVTEATVAPQDKAQGQATPVTANDFGKPGAPGTTARPPEGGAGTVSPMPRETIRAGTFPASITEPE